MSRKGLHSIGQMGEGRQGEEERQFLALSQVLGSGAGFWHCLLVSLGLGEGCGVGVLMGGGGAGDSLLAAGFFPFGQRPSGNGEDSKGKTKKGSFLPPASVTSYADFLKIQISGGW